MSAIARQVFVGKRFIIFRLPKKCRFPGVSGWVKLPKDRWNVRKGAITPSVIINFTGKPEHRRHFWIMHDADGELYLESCNDDPWYWKKDAGRKLKPADRRLPYIPRFWIEELLDLLPPKNQVSRVGMADEDY